MGYVIRDEIRKVWLGANDVGPWTLGFVLCVMESHWIVRISDMIQFGF